MGTLYILTSPVGKSYIGISSKTTEARWAKHVEHALGKRDNGALYSALRKYGPANFEIRTLVVSNDWDYLCELEIAAIRAFETLSPKGYNISEGGEGVTGPRDDEFKRKVSIAQKKRFESKEQREKLRAIAKSISPEARKRGAERASATMRTPEYRAKASEIAKQQFSSPDARKKLSDALKAAFTPERRAAASKRSKELMASPKMREAISRATRAGMQSEAVKAKVVAAAKNRAASPEWRQKISRSKSGKKLGAMDEAHKEKIRQARKREWNDPEKRTVRLEAMLRKQQERRAARPPLLCLAVENQPDCPLLMAALRDDEGRYPLSFIFRLAGGEAALRPGEFLSLESTKRLISTLPMHPAPVVRHVGPRGSFAVSAILSAYALWIDPQLNVDLLFPDA